MVCPTRAQVCRSLQHCESSCGAPRVMPVEPSNPHRRSWHHLASYPVNSGVNPLNSSSRAWVCFGHVQTNSGNLHLPLPLMNLLPPMKLLVTPPRPQEWDQVPPPVNSPSQAWVCFGHPQTNSGNLHLPLPLMNLPLMNLLLTSP